MTNENCIEAKVNSFQTLCVGDILEPTITVEYGRTCNVWDDWSNISCDKVCTLFPGDHMMTLEILGPRDQDPEDGIWIKVIVLGQSLIGWVFYRQERFKTSFYLI